MSNKVWKLTTPGIYDKVHLVDIHEQADGYANFIIRYSLSGVVVAGTDQVASVTDVDYDSWKLSWDSSTNTIIEHMLSQWVANNSIASGSLTDVGS